MTFWTLVAKRTNLAFFAVISDESSEGERIESRSLGSYRRDFFYVKGYRALQRIDEPSN